MNIAEMIENKVKSILGKTPEGRKALQIKETERRQIRAKAVKEIDALKKRQEKELPGLKSQLEETIAAFYAAQTKLHEAIETNKEAQRVLQSFNHTTHHEQINLEKVLRETADPSIEAFLLEMRNIPRAAFVDTYKISDEKVSADDSPAKAAMIRREGLQLHAANRLKAIAAARESAEGMLLQDLSPEDVQRKLSELRESLPELLVKE